MTSIDLDIDNYSLDDILKLFKIDYNLTNESMKHAKSITLKMHPDKSGLDKEYFLFFAKAYKLLYKLYIFQDKSREKNLNSDYKNYNIELDKDKQDILNRLNKDSKFKKNFNKWFNDEFDKIKLHTDFEKNGYSDWLKNENYHDNRDNNRDNCKNISDVHNEISKKRQHINKLAKTNKINEYNNASYCDIGNNLPDNYSSDIFSKLQYEDLKKAHTENIINIEENNIKNRNLQDIQNERDKHIEVLSEKKSNKILNDTYREKKSVFSVLLFH